MLKGGPVIRYMEKFAGDSNNKVILVSYQAEDTPGRQLLNGAREIEFGDEKLKIKINMKVEYFHLSAHADRPQLLSLVGRVQRAEDHIRRPRRGGQVEGALRRAEGQVRREAARAVDSVRGLISNSPRLLPISFMYLFYRFSGYHAFAKAF